MVVLASVKVDLRKICEDDARDILKDFKLKFRDKYYEEHVVYFIQADRKALEKEGYLFDSDSKLTDNIWLRLYKNDDRPNEISKKSFLEMFKQPTSRKSSPRKPQSSGERKVRSPRRLQSPRRKSPSKKPANALAEEEDDYE